MTAWSRWGCRAPSLATGDAVRGLVRAGARGGIAHCPARRRNRRAGQCLGCAVAFSCAVVGDALVVPEAAADGIREAVELQVIPTSEGSVPDTWQLWDTARRHVRLASAIGYTNPELDAAVGSAGAFVISLPDAASRSFASINAVSGMLAAVTVAPDRALSIEFIARDRNEVLSGSVTEPAVRQDPGPALRHMEPETLETGFVNWLEKLRSDSVRDVEEPTFVSEGWALSILLSWVDWLSEDLIPIWKLRHRLLPLFATAAFEVRYRLNQRSTPFHDYFPDSEIAVAPTAIGNVLRSVDSYCTRVYGLEAKLVLPRLQAVMSAETLGRLQAAEERLQLLEWSWLGLAVLGAVAVGISTGFGRWEFALLMWVTSWPIAVLVVYPAAVAAAVGYAEQLRLAFDRERGYVLAALGLKLPTRLNEEKRVWQALADWWETGSLDSEYKLAGQASPSVTRT
jgi:hypothetical protein